MNSKTEQVAKRNCFIYKALKNKTHSKKELSVKFNLKISTIENICSKLRKILQTKSDRLFSLIKTRETYERKEMIYEDFKFSRETGMTYKQICKKHKIHKQILSGIIKKFSKLETEEESRKYKSEMYFPWSEI